MYSPVTTITLQIESYFLPAVRVIKPSLAKIGRKLAHTRATADILDNVVNHPLHTPLALARMHTAVTQLRAGVLAQDAALCGHPSLTEPCNIVRIARVRLARPDIYSR